MERMYWEHQYHGIVAWIDTEDGKTWFRFLDEIDLVQWASHQQVTPIEITH